MIRLPGRTRGRRLLVGAAGVALVAGAGAAALVGPGPNHGAGAANQPVGVVPHLVPDVGTLHPGSQGTSSAPHVGVLPGIRLIPSAGGPVSAYGGSPGGATFLPAQKKG